jgi:hypothetical protein
MATLEVGRKRTKNGNYNRYFGKLRHIARVVPMEDITPIAERIVRRIYNNRLQMQCGSYVFGDSGGWIYVVSEGSNVSTRIVKLNESLIVGRYAAGDVVAFPAVIDVLEDLVEHYSPFIPDRLLKY